jgi:hypothetical protein
MRKDEQITADTKRKSNIPNSVTVSTHPPWNTLLKRGNKNVDIKFSAHERFWNNLHQVAQNQKIGKPNNLIFLGAQDLWVLVLITSLRI